ncbi:MAG TPA: hypothetical protein VJJ77_02450, partial [Dongiaceae bacterium]|nr:hypothetical protein [Dongiaceae bacterium]
HAAHERAYGHADPAAPVEMVNLRGDGFVAMPKPPPPAAGAEATGDPRPAGRRRVYLDRAAGWRDCAVFRRDDLRPGHRLVGPAVVMQRDSTVLALPDQEARVERHGVIRIRARKE